MQNSLKFPEEISFLPPSCGVYIMKNKEGEVLYIGKAKSLRNRVKSYKNPKDPKTAALSEKIKNVEFVVTSSEDEALLLENNLIKKHLPKYNIRLVDDVNYPYIKVTNEKYPKITKVYRIRGENGEYFGPFPHGHIVDVTVKTLRKIFPIRSCNLKISESKTYEPCLLYHIGLCSAPCAHKISMHDYLKVVESMKLFLKGEDSSVLQNMKAELEKAKNNLDYERAIIYRDAVRSLTEIIEKQRVVSSYDISFDLFACEIENNVGCLVKISVRNGRVISSYPFIVNVTSDSKEDVFENFILLYPFHIQHERVFLEAVPKNKKALERYLLTKNSKKIYIQKIRNGISKEILSLAKENAKTHLRNYLERHMHLKEERILLNLKKNLKLSRIPIRIEGYDISNISGSFAVGSMVVFTSGNPDKKEYRKFKIKLTKGPDDYAMLFEVLSRRFTTSKDFSKEKPDLLLIDGGKGQLDIALKIKNFLNIDVDVISLAKREEMVFSEYLENPVAFQKESDELKLLQRVRDEAHRFAKRYFKILHSRTAKQK